MIRLKLKQFWIKGVKEGIFQKDENMSFKHFDSHYIFYWFFLICPELSRKINYSDISNSCYTFKKILNSYFPHEETYILFNYNKDFYAKCCDFFDKNGILTGANNFISKSRFWERISRIKTIVYGRQNGRIFYSEAPIKDGVTIYTLEEFIAHYNLFVNEINKNSIRIIKEFVNTVNKIIK